MLYWTLMLSKKGVGGKGVGDHGGMDIQDLCVRILRGVEYKSYGTETNKKPPYGYTHGYPYG